MYTCPECEKEINQATEVCPYCGAEPARAAEEAPPATKPSLGKTIFRYGVLLAAMWAFLWYVLPERTAREAARRAENLAVEGLRAAHAELAQFAAAQGGGFPPALESLPPESLRKVKAAAEAALAEGYRLEYTPLGESAVGRVEHYVLLARPRNFGFLNFFMDDSGVIRATREDRAATAADPPLAARPQ
jgi:hypothetical protein